MCCTVTDDPRLPASVRVLRGRKWEFEKVGDLPPPPPPLVGGGIMHPQGITLIYGQGGIGKGWIACYAIRALVEEGYHPCILDFEGFRWEWLTRLYWMGIRHEDGVGYLTVDGHMSRELSDEVGFALEAEGYTHVILDSVSAARKAAREADSGGGDAAMDLFRSVNHMGKPALMLAHEAKRSAGPIGSVQYTNQSRLVWHATSPSNLSVELAMEKVNDRPHAGKSLTFSWVILPDGATDFVRGGMTRQPEKAQQEESTTHAILRILKAVDRSMDREQMQKALYDEGREIDVVKVGNIMRLLLREGKVTRVDRGRYAFPVPQEPLDDKA